MLFDNQSRGKVIINIREEDGRLSSMVQRKGVAENDKTALGAVLATYISMCHESGKDPRDLLEMNLKPLEKQITESKK
jgi:hypothetical protein